MKLFDKKNQNAFKHKKIQPSYLALLQGYLNGCSTALSPLINKSVLGQAKSCEHA